MKVYNFLKNPYVVLKGNEIECSLAKIEIAEAVAYRLAEKCPGIQYTVVKFISNVEFPNVDNEL